MNVRRQRFFAGSGFPAEQNARVGFRDKRRLLHGMSKGATASDHLWNIADNLTKAFVFPPQLGTYQVTDAGDVGVDKSGEASLRKRITRRVLAASNSYFHLRGYGVGIQLKRTITVDMLRRLSARIRAQVLREPEVQTVKCFLAQDPAAPDVVRCTIEAETGAGPVQAVVPIQLP